PCVRVMLYMRAMFIFFDLVEYWQAKRLPIFEFFRRSPTFFSEESGELALSQFTRSRPTCMRCDYEQTRKAWLLVKQVCTASSDADKDSKVPAQKKAFRTICMSLFSKTISFFALLFRSLEYLNPEKCGTVFFGCFHQTIFLKIRLIP